MHGKHGGLSSTFHNLLGYVTLTTRCHSERSEESLTDETRNPTLYQKICFAEPAGSSLHSARNDGLRGDANRKTPTALRYPPTATP